MSFPPVLSGALTSSGAPEILLCCLLPPSMDILASTLLWEEAMIMPLTHKLIRWSSEHMFGTNIDSVCTVGHDVLSVYS